MPRSDIRTKIKTLDELTPIILRLKKEGRKIVTTNGVYDILHPGHIRSLEEAKKEGDVLIVGVNSDNSVKRYKGEKRPIQNENHRAEILAALACVDFVFIFDEDDPRAFLERLQPHVHANGADYGRNCIEYETVIKYDGRLHILKKYKGFSTTEIIKHIQSICQKS